MYRKDLLITGHIYHIFNRGVNKATIFYSEDDFIRFYNTAIYYLTRTNKYSQDKRMSKDSDTVSEKVKKESAVKILAYCLMSNHFHFLVEQLVDNGITDYFRRLTNSYSHYINIKYKRVGPLFQGRFKNVLVESDEQLMHVTRYIHLNPLVSRLVSDLNYRWSSYHSLFGERKDDLCDNSSVLAYFKRSQEYKEFVLNQADYAKTLDKIKHLAFDYD